MRRLPAGPFGTLLADPPWAFRTYTGKNTVAHRCATDHYRTMSAETLRALPVVEIAARDSALFMWVVDSHLDQALDLARCWGFSYKTVAFVWDKGRMGMGYWTRKEAELCLLFTRGKPKVLDHGVRQIIRASRREHSRKPDETHLRIERLVSGPYCELFAREPREGWTIWGNETTKFSEQAA